MSELYADRTIAAYRWGSKEAIKNWRRNRRPSRFLQQFVGSLPPGSKVLDYGCGIGRDLNWMRRQGFVVEGVEGTLEFVKEARRHSPESRIDHARFEKVSLPKREYDGIWCNAALIHVPPTVLREQLNKLRAALKPNGLLGLTLAWGQKKGFTQRDWIPGRYVAGYRKAEVKGLLKGWTAPEIQVLLRDGRQGRWIQILTRAAL